MNHISVLFLRRNMYSGVTKTFDKKNQIKVDFERKNRHFPDPKMDTFSQTSNCLQVFAEKNYALIFDTEPFQKAYRRSRGGSS